MNLALQLHAVLQLLPDYFEILSVLMRKFQVSKYGIQSPQARKCRELLNVATRRKEAPTSQKMSRCCPTFFCPVGVPFLWGPSSAENAEHS